MTDRPYKRAAHDDARRLRRSGQPIKRIANQLGVAQSTVSVWVRDIPLTPEQHEANRRGPLGPLASAGRRGRAWSERNRERRRAWQREGQQRARAHEPLHLTGCMLYWAEGAKSRNSVRLSNSDPNLVRQFRRFLTEALGVTPERILLALNVYTGNGLSVGDIERFWLETLELPDSSLRGHTLNHRPTSSSGRRPHRLPFGVCTLTVNSTAVVQHIYGAIQEYGAFSEPRWLDGPARQAVARKTRGRSSMGSPP